MISNQKQSMISYTSMSRLMNELRRTMFESLYRTNDVWSTLEEEMIIFNYCWHPWPHHQNIVLSLFFLIFVVVALQHEENLIACFHSDVWHICTCIFEHCLTYFFTSISNIQLRILVTIVTFGTFLQVFSDI